MNKKIGIIGSLGMVGGSLKRYFQNHTKHILYLYDKKGEGSFEEINEADYIYIAVPTPNIEGEGCDLSILEDAIRNLSGMKVIIIKSTIPPGTTQKLQDKYIQHKFLFNPEFLTESTADQDMNYPDRQIIGYTDKSYGLTGEIISQLPLATYEAIVPAFIAEFSKYVANTWFTVKVSKNNETYDLFKKFGGNDEQFEKLIDCVAGDKRIGRSHLSIYHKGYRGYGGKCLPKDSKSFLQFAKQLKVDLPVLQSAVYYNDKLLKQQGLDEFKNPK